MLVRGALACRVRFQPCGIFPALEYTLEGIGISVEVLAVPGGLSLFCAVSLPYYPMALRCRFYERFVVGPCKRLCFALRLDVRFGGRMRSLLDFLL